MDGGFDVIGSSFIREELNKAESEGNGGTGALGCDELGLDDDRLVGKAVWELVLGGAVAGEVTGEDTGVFEQQGSGADGCDGLFGLVEGLDELEDRLHFPEVEDSGASWEEEYIEV